MTSIVSQPVDAEKGSYEMVAQPSVARGTSSKKNAPDFVWSSVNFKIGEKKILNDCWGKVKAGSICAIMGPSGAGKSSLLNVLAGRSSNSSNTRIDGLVTVGGVEINPVAYRKNIAYVMQDDALVPTATPREALKFSATMRLADADTMSEADIDALVEKTMEELGLTEDADSIIGGVLIKGISGGKRKRVSVGVELIAGPSLLFLDEPTSGLDSYFSYHLIVLLKKVAAESCTILCTIHQPSSEVFFLFDIVVFMMDGHILYQGPITNIVPHYASLGMKCPENYNPSDFIMNMAQVETVEDLRAKGCFAEVPMEFLALGGSSKKLGLEENEDIEFTTNNSFYKQVMMLTVREVVNFRRDTMSLISRFGVTIVLALIFGLIFLNCGKGDNGITKDFNSHVGAVSLVSILALFGSAQQVMLQFPFERPIFMREYATGTYKTFAYMISKLCIEIPVVFAQTVVMYLLIFYLMQFRGQFILHVLVGTGLALVSNSVAMLLGCILGNVKDVTEVSPIAFVPQFLFAGFFIRTSQIPIFLRWAQWLCSVKYAMNLYLLIEFHPSLPSCNTSPAAIQNCADVLSSNGIEAQYVWLYCILLAVLFFVFRIASGIVLIQKGKKFY